MTLVRYYYDESEDDIDDYSRKPVFHILLHSSLISKNSQIYTQPTITTQFRSSFLCLHSIIVLHIRFPSYFRSSSSSSTLWVAPSSSKCGRAGLSLTGPPIHQPEPHFLTNSGLHYSPHYLSHNSSAPTSASSPWRPSVLETWLQTKRWRMGRRGLLSARSTSSLASPWLPWASTLFRRRSSSPLSPSSSY